MKLKYNFISSNVGEQIIAVPVGNNAENFNGMLTLNEEGAAILELLKNDIEEEEIIDALASKYEESSREDISALVKEFLDKLKSADLLE